MELAPLASAATGRDLDLRTLTFDYLTEPTLLLDPQSDEIVDANPAACTLLGYDRALLREMRLGHQGQGRWLAAQMLGLWRRVVSAHGSCRDHARHRR